MNDLLTWIGDLFRLLTQRLYTILEVFGVNFYSLVLLLFLYLFYWQFDQAQDLLLTLNQEKDWQVMLFFFTTGNLAAICWYLPKYLYPENEETFHKVGSAIDFINADVTHHCPPEDEEETEAELIALNRKDYNVMIPRFLGTAVLMIVALAILNVANEVNPEEFRVSATTLLIIFGLAFLTILLVSRDKMTILTLVINWIKSRLDKQVFWLYLYFILVGIVLGVLAWLNRGNILGLYALVFGSLLIALSFFVFTVFRSYLPFFKSNRNMVATLLAVSIFSSLSFIIINISTGTAQKLNPLICANLAFVLYLSFFYLFRVIGKRRKIYLVTILLLITTVLFFWTSSKRFYQVKYVSNLSSTNQQKYPVEDRVSMSTYFKEWVNHRRGFIQNFVDQKGYFPIFVMASEGGGSRAAYWTSIAYGYIQNQAPDFYDQHLFAMTGASGGMTGSSSFFSMKEGGLPDKDIHSSAHKMFEQNFLSGTLTRLLGFDLWQEIFGLNILENRAVVLQEEWADQLEIAAGVKTFEKPFLSFWYEEGTTNINKNVPPLVLVNTTFVQRGNHAVFSPVTYDSTYYRGYDLLAQIDRVSDHQNTVQLNTTAVLNASFPYICPAGFVNETGNFVDAGYYDNLGAQTAIGILGQLEAVQKEMQKDSLYEKFRFIGVQTRNDLSVPKKRKSVVNHQLNAPLIAFSKISSGYVEYDEWKYSEAPDAFFQINLTQEDIIEGQDTIRPIIPLARYLSELAIQAMDSSLVVQAREVNSSLNRIVREMK